MDDAGGVLPGSVRHRLAAHWPVLWTQFGVRPMDVGSLTVGEVALIEASVKRWEQEARRAQASGRRR